MFARVKKSGRYQYLQIVHNERVGDGVKQRVIATLGRLDRLRENGQLDAMLSSCAKFSEHAAVISAAREKSVAPQATVHIVSGGECGDQFCGTTGTNSRNVDHRQWLPIEPYASRAF